jgi:hypothetical protein
MIGAENDVPPPPDQVSGVPVQGAETDELYRGSEKQKT